MSQPEIKSCTGCAMSQPRFRRSVPRLWCIRFHVPAEVRCIEYRSKSAKLQAAMDTVRRVFTR